MTKREMFERIATVNAADEEIVAFCNREIELLEKRKSGKKGLTKTQKENEGVKELILTALAESGEKMTVSEVIGCEGLGGFSNQKISALLRQLIEAGKVEKTMEGKKAYFSIKEGGEG